MPDGFTVVVDRDACIGSGTCVSYAPKSFTQGDDDAKAMFLDPPGDTYELIKEVVQACPMGALSLVDKE
ncbi:MAG TPA: ferredoxin [Mycobacteriales bacterium]|nr:ferredoxin [Mycobacteriales bacterium]